MHLFIKCNSYLVLTMCSAWPALDDRDIRGSKKDILSECKELQRRTMKRNLKLTFSRGRVLVKMS